MKHQFKRDASLELLETVKYYKAQRTDLGREFLDEFDLGLKAIKEAPDRWPIFENERRYHLDRFPYHIVYEVKDGVLVVIAVAYAHRKPGYWRNRRS